MTEEERERKFLDSLPVSVHTKNGKPLSEKQLKNLLKLLREDFDKRNPRD
jgi:hypothetical protein